MLLGNFLWIQLMACKENSESMRIEMNHNESCPWHNAVCKQSDSEVGTEPASLTPSAGLNVFSDYSMLLCFGVLLTKVSLLVLLSVAGLGKDGYGELALTSSFLRCSQQLGLSWTKEPGAVLIFHMMIETLPHERHLLPSRIPLMGS